MKLSEQTAKHLRDVYFGGSWTTANLKDVLSDVDWKQAITQVYSFNTIAVLTYHVSYFVTAVTEVLEGEPLNSKDEYSFNHPPIESEEDWQNLLDKTWADAEKFARLIEQLPENRFFENFIDPKYGNYFRNFHGIIEHLHYHLGQIVLIKKIVQGQEK